MANKELAHYDIYFQDNFDTKTWFANHFNYNYLSVFKLTMKYYRFHRFSQVEVTTEVSNIL